MTDAARARRLADSIKRIVASTIEFQIKDPRLGFVTVTAVKLTPDLREATIFYTVLGGDDERTGSALALRSATGVLRFEVGRQTGVRFTPLLTFESDEVPEHAKHIDELLERVRVADAAVAAAAAGATPAGEPDPYRSTTTAEDEE